MRIYDEVRKCVAFLQYKGSDQELRFAGTAFFVGVSVLVNGAKRVFTYAVTARHVIEGIGAKTLDQRVYFRLNQTDGQVGVFHADIDGWQYHPSDERVDLAVIPVGLDALDHLGYPVEMCATDEIIEKERIGIGDEIFLVGLFSGHTGAKRNIPIVRVGNIAAMPEEPVNTAWGEIDAYLVESRSIGGLSGSPVFVHLGEVRVLDGDLKFHRGGSHNRSEGLFYLLGVMNAHWDGSISDMDIMSLDGMPRASVNMGIAVVTPVRKILEIIDQPRFKRGRDQAVSAIERETAASMDAVVPEDTF